MARDAFTFKYESSILTVPAGVWKSLEQANFPFTDFAFLAALEKSGSVGGETGWTPRYLMAWSGGRLEGAVVWFEKAHSYGEYIFDWEWANAYYQSQLLYYPKLTAAVPFTPATGSKLLIRNDTPVGNLREQLLNKINADFVEGHESSLHHLFIPENEIPLFEKTGYLIRHSFQYHWRNEGYESFPDFLSRLKSRKRKQIRHERESVQKSGVTTECLTGEALTPGHAEELYLFYCSTIEEKSSYAYLAPTFFDLLFREMKNQIVYFRSISGGALLAGSLCLMKGDTLFGRYWGSRVTVPFLHFELCYYAPIEFAIQRGLKLFEAGAQGEHKISRGFLPTLTYSAHEIRHPRFREAIADFIHREKRAIAEYFESAVSESPFAEDSV